MKSLKSEEKINQMDEMMYQRDDKITLRNRSK
jgi:hypothetical protein